MSLPVSGGIVGRDAELRLLDRFLGEVAGGPRVLALSGEAGIGKSTLWQAGLERATAQSYRTLSCRSAPAEVRLGYAGLTDLLGDVDDRFFAPLPVPQREALESALLRASHPVTAPDPRAVAVGFVAVLERLGAEGPVIVAVDDLPWLDASTAAALRFAVRRLTAAVGILVSARTDDERSLRELRPRDPDCWSHIQVGPLDSVALHRLIVERTGRPLPRPLFDRVRRASAGNPFYALELARAFNDPSRAADVFPRSLAELVDDRIAGLSKEVRTVLLAAGALSDPSMEVVRRALEAATGDKRPTELMHLAEDEGIIGIDGGRIRFLHPLLASGVYAAASPGERRAVHERLAGVTAGEERARHLALAASEPDADVVDALDDAARAAVGRGAPAAAAELLELALGLGADDPARRIRAAAAHCRAGDLARGLTLVEESIAVLEAGRLRSEALSLLGTLHYTAYRLADAATVLAQATVEAGDDLSLLIPLELDMAFVLTNLGRIPEALPYARSAAEHAAEQGDDGARAQALASLVMAAFVSGQGIDEATLQRALELEDRGRPGRAHNQPTTIAALCRLFAGQFGEARTGLDSVRQGCIERGEDSDVPLLTFWTVLLEWWRGDLDAAQAAVDDLAQRASMLASPVQDAMALAAEALVGALAGRADETRRAAHESLMRFQAADLQSWATWPLAALCALDVSIGEYGAVAATAGPVAVMLLESMGLAEPTIVPLIPDVAEALIGLARLDEAERLVDVLEARGRALDRVWAMAAGARVRALLLAARGDVPAALLAVDEALAHHERLDVPLERARALMVRGQLHRRSREKRRARESLTEALAMFEGIGSREWARRATEELGRVNIRPPAPLHLSATEARVAGLAAQGLTNKQIAAAAFMTPKTVEANLARIYRKLGISSRAQLGSIMGSGASASPPQT